MPTTQKRKTRKKPLSVETTHQEMCRRIAEMSIATDQEKHCAVIVPSGPGRVLDFDPTLSASASDRPDFDRYHAGSYEGRDYNKIVCVRECVCASVTVTGLMTRPIFYDSGTVGEVLFFKAVVCTFSAYLNRSLRV